MAAAKRRKKPREVPRPQDERQQTPAEVRASFSGRRNEQGRVVRGHRQMLAAFAEQQGVTLGSPA